MKTIKINTLVGAVMLSLSLLVFKLAGCHNDPLSTISGTYINAANGEFSRANDTLVIQAGQGDQYLIHRKTGFNRIREGHAGRREYETEEWKGTYDQASGLFTQSRNHKQLRFDPKAKKLVIGSRTYQKIN